LLNGFSTVSWIRRPMNRLVRSGERKAHHNG
jgi:hypothetical protein